MSIRLSNSAHEMNDCDYLHKLSKDQLEWHQAFIDGFYGAKGDKASYDRANCMRRDIMSGAGVFEVRKRDEVRRAALKLQVPNPKTSDSELAKRQLKALVGVARFKSAMQQVQSEEREQVNARVSFLGETGEEHFGYGTEDQMVEAIDLRSQS